MKLHIPGDFRLQKNDMEWEAAFALEFERNYPNFLTYTVALSICYIVVFSYHILLTKFYDTSVR